MRGLRKCRVPGGSYRAVSGRRTPKDKQITEVSCLARKDCPCLVTPVTRKDDIILFGQESTSGWSPVTGLVFYLHSSILVFLLLLPSFFVKDPRRYTTKLSGTDTVVY